MYFSNNFLKELQKKDVLYICFVVERNYKYNCTCISSIIYTSDFQDHSEIIMYTTHSI